MNKPTPDQLPLARLAGEGGAFDFLADEPALYCGADVQATAGKVISHEAVRRWLLSWSKADELPPPECGE